MSEEQELNRRNNILIAMMNGVFMYAKTALVAQLSIGLFMAYIFINNLNVVALALLSSILSSLVLGGSYLSQAFFYNDKESAGTVFLILNVVLFLIASSIQIYICTYTI